MPRNAAGVYTLTPTNPVVPFTTIATAWANPTLSDIAAALTNSLDRTGLGGMLAPFRVFDGTLATPGIAFTNEISLGIYRPALGVMAFVSGGLEAFQVTPNGLISLTRLEHHGLDVYKTLGFKSWKAVNEAGVWTLTPSASVDAEDWDTAHAIRLTSAGNLQIPGNLDIAGALSAASLTLVALTVTGNASIAGTLVVPVVDTDLVSSKKFTQEPVIAGGVTGTYAANYALGQSHVLTLTGAVAITPSNIPAGSILRVTLIATTNTPTFSGVIWPLGVAPNLAAGPVKKAIVVIENDGAQLLASALTY